MHNKYSKNEIIKIVTTSAKKYKENLLNKNIMFIYKENNKISHIETIFKDYNFDDVKEKVMVIGSFSNVRELKLFERESGFSTYKMNNVTENFPMYMYNETSVVFLLTEQLKCHAFF